MNWFLAGWVLVLQALFWGLGLTLLLLPRRWRPFWPAFCALVGLALQSAVVWAAAHTTLPGTDSYAFVSLLLPVGFLAAAFRRFGTGPTVRLLAGVRRWWILALVMSVSLGLQIAPFTKPPARFTVLSLGSCDAADYAAGARVFKEFSARDRTGFLGQPEQVRGLSVDNFYDFWLRINHFTPSALIALDATLLRRQPYELTSLLGIVLLLLSLPVVFWLGRSLFRFGPAAAATVALIYGCSPVLLYAVYQVALGQLLAAPAVGLILWTSLRADQAGRAWYPARRQWAFSGLLLAGNWLLFGGYNFFVLFAYVPLAAFVGGRVLWHRRGWAEAGRLAAFIGVNLLACALLFPARVISLAERFLLFKKTPFGWKIAAFRPDGWYGAFGDAYLRPGAAWSFGLGVVCLLALGAAAAWAVRAGRGRMVALAAACTLPIFCGYGILTWEELAGIRKNTSYDAYKLFTVFYPVLLLSLCLWLAVGLRRAGPVWVKGCTAGLAAIVLAVNFAGSCRYNAILRFGTYTVGSGLSELSALEHRPEVDSINVRLKTEWNALWANQFLLHKTHYFSGPIYEGRSVTPLLGNWDLSDRYTALDLPPAQDSLATDPEFAVVDRHGTQFIDTQLTGGWYEPEQFRGSHWCWSGISPVISVTNPHPEARDAVLHLAARSYELRHLRLFAGETLVWEGVTEASVKHFAPLTLHLPPGQTLFRFESSEPPDRPPGDIRQLVFALYGFQMQPLPESVSPANGVPVGAEPTQAPVARP